MPESIEGKARIGQLEVGLAETRSDVGAIRRELHSLATSVNSLAEFMKASQKTNWPVITSVVGVIVSMMVAFGAFFLASINDNERTLEKLGERLLAHELKAGHPDRVLIEMQLREKYIQQRIDQLDKLVERIDNHGSRYWNKDRINPQ